MLHDRCFAKDADLARKNCRRNKVTGNGAHLFAKARHFAGSNREGRFGRDVARAKPGTACRQDEVSLALVGQPAELLFQGALAIGQKQLFHDFKTSLFQPLGNDGSAGIFAQAFTALIRQSNDRSLIWPFPLPRDSVMTSPGRMTPPSRTRANTPSLGMMQSPTAS